MREFLEDAHTHQDSGYGRAQAHAQRELPKRFYKETGIAPVEGGYSVTLDGRTTRTPGRMPVVVPFEALASDMAAEWAAQGEFIDALTMPLVRLVNSAIEGGESALSGLRTEILNYAGNDLLLYRADTPRELVEAQEAHWDVALVALARHFGVRFQPTVGIIHQAQPEEVTAKLGVSLGTEGLFVLAALASITNLTGSGLLPIGLRHKLFDADFAWAAAHVDEDFNMRLWGADPEAIKRRTQRRSEYDAAVRVLALSD